MTEDTVKLTVRLPAQLHRVLKERALEYNVSLNQVMVDTLTAEFVVAPSPEEQTRESSTGCCASQDCLQIPVGWRIT